MKRIRHFAVFEDDDNSGPAIQPALFVGTWNECESFVRGMDTSLFRCEPLANCTRQQTANAQTVNPQPGHRPRIEQSSEATSLMENENEQQ